MNYVLSLLWQLVALNLSHIMLYEILNSILQIKTCVESTMHEIDRR